MNDENRCPGTNRNGEPCGHPAGWGTDKSEGPCKFHGGATPTAEENPKQGRGNQDQNQNATSHGIHAKTNPFYKKVLSDDIKAVVDDIYEDYVEDYEERHGEPPFGHTAELFRIAVSYGKHLHSEDWAINKPSDLNSGNAMVDKETTIKTTQHDAVKEDSYKQTVVQKGQQSLSQDRRMWLKDLGLLDDPESKKAEGMQDIASAWAGELERGTEE